MNGCSFPCFPMACQFFRLPQNSLNSARKQNQVIVTMKPTSLPRLDMGMIRIWLSNGFFWCIYIYILFLAAVKYHNLECLATCNNWGIASSCICLASPGRSTAWFSERRHLWEGWLLVLHKGCSDGFVLRMYRWHRFQREPKKNSQSQHHSRWCSMTSPPSSFSVLYIYIYILAWLVPCSRL